MRRPYPLALAILLTGAFLIVIYWPGLHGDFFFDDGPSILMAEGVRFTELSAASLRQALSSGYAGPSGRPIAQLSFALNHYFTGYAPFAFKATNLAIHGLCSLLVFVLALRLLASPQRTTKPQNALIAAGALSAAWLFHPIQLTVVLLAVQRMTALSALFLLTALLLHISAREQAGRAGTVKLIAAWGLLWPLSFFSKETGALFPLFALAWELIVRRADTGRLDRFARIFAAATGVFLLATMAYALSPRGQWLWTGYDLRNFSPLERLLTEGRVLWFYLGLILFPRLQALGLYHDDIAVSTGLLAPWTTLTAMGGLVGLLWLAWWTRNRAPLVSFGIAWFLIGHGLESTALPLEIAYEHRNYLPFFGILLAGAWALHRALESAGMGKTIVTALTVAMLANFIFVTALRSHQFGNEGLRTQTEAEHHPDSARAQHEAGRLLAGQAEAALPDKPAYGLAQSRYQRACDLDRAAKMCWLGLIQLNCRAGKPAKQEWVLELARRFRETPFAPADSNVFYAIKEASVAGALCLNRADVDGLFAAAFANPGLPPWTRAILHSWHADYLWLHERDMTAARDALGRSLALNPANSSNRLKWAQLIFLSGEREQARQLLLVLRNENLLADEQQTVNELLATYKGR